MVEAATEFKKSGFSDEDAAQLAQIAAMYQNVADEAVSTGESANFIISQMKAFGLEAQDATHIIDALNAVSNSQAVSSADLANNIGKASSAMALGNNTYEQSLAMMTAMTEINRSGAKSARALVSVQSRLSQVLDDQSSTGQALIGIYDELGVELYDMDGQLRPTFEIFKDLAEIWPTLSTNQKDYIALTQAGSNQTQNFVALMDNFQTALDSEQTALHSTNSALDENARYMESLEAKTTALKATFQDLANNVIDSELVGSLLTLANNVLEALNTEVGTTVTQWGLLTGALTGGIVIFGDIGAKLIASIKAITTFTGALGAGAGVASTFVSVALPIAGILTAVTMGGISLARAWKNANPTLEEAMAQIKSNTEQLASNKKRLEEIDALSWDEKTTEILNEKVALEKENAELERQIKLYEKKKKTQIESDGLTLTQRESEVRAYGVTGHGVDKTGFVISEDDIEKYEELGYVVEEVAKTASYAGEELRRKLTANVNYLTTAMEEGTFANDKYAEVIRTETLEALSYLADGSWEYKSLLKELTEATEVYSGALEAEAKNAEIVANGLELNKDAYDKIAKSQPKIIELTNEVNGLYYIEEERLRQLVVTSDQYKNGRIKDEYDLTVSVIENAQARIQALQDEMSALEEFGKTATGNELAQAEKLYGVKFNQLSGAKSTLSNAQNRLAGLLGGLTWSPFSTGDSGKSTSAKDLELERLKGIVTLRENELDLLEERGDSEESQVNKMREIQVALHNQAEYMRSIGGDEADIVALSTKWWTYEKKITSELDSQVRALKQQLEVAKKSTELMENRVEDLTSKASLYGDVFTDFVDEQLSALEAEKSEIEEFYDSQINALKETNDELEEQIAYETALKNLAEARSKKVLVYRNGQFQYAEDADAISVAQAELSDLEREKKLEAETRRLEELKSNAIDSINAQIESWEKYRAEWEDLADDVGKTQDEIAYKQQLATKLEGNTWDERINNLKDYINGYKALMNELNNAQEKLESAKKEQDKLQSQVSAAEDKQFAISNINAQMAANSEAWHTASDSEKKKLEEANKTLANQKASLTGTSASFNSASGTWSYNKYATGTLSAPGGISCVGEQGPELRVLNQGDGIIPADVTRNLWDWGKFNPKSMRSTMSQVFNIDNLTLPNVRNAETLVAGLKQMAYQRAYKRA